MLSETEKKVCNEIDLKERDKDVLENDYEMLNIVFDRLKQLEK